MVPFMKGWIEQKYSIVPGWVSLMWKVAPGFMVGEEVNFGPFT
jgi:hypothetical protein